MHKVTALARRLIQIAAIWALAVSLLFFFLPQRVEIQEATLVPGETTEVETVIEEKSFYEIQGLWGTVVLVLFAGFYAVPLRFVASNKRLLLVTWGLLALALSYITGFSIGLWYLPSALLLLAGSLTRVAFKA
jgi:hypothetical protein